MTVAPRFFMAPNAHAQRRAAGLPLSEGTLSLWLARPYPHRKQPLRVRWSVLLERMLDHYWDAVRNHRQAVVLSCHQILEGPWMFNAQEATRTLKLFFKPPTRVDLKQPSVPARANRPKTHQVTLVNDSKAYDVPDLNRDLLRIITSDERNQQCVWHILHSSERQRTTIRPRGSQRR